MILQMAAAELGDIAVFPFLEPPDRSQINDGLRLLTELGALAEGGRGAPDPADQGRPPARRRSGGPAARPDAARG